MLIASAIAEKILGFNKDCDEFFQVDHMQENIILDSNL
jgi:hypothetical protein